VHLAFPLRVLRRFTDRQAIEAPSYSVELPSWVILYPPGRAIAPDTADRRERMRSVEGVVDGGA
jgi:hypothetical protein